MVLPESFELSTVIKQTKPIVLPAAFFLGCVYVDSAAQIISDLFQLGEQLDAPLPDLGFKFLFFIDWHPLPTILMTLTALVTLIRILFSPHRVLAIRRYFLIHGIVFLVRAITLSLTRFPRPDIHCEPVQNISILLGAFRVMTGFVTTCSDCMFSGHAAGLVLFALFWRDYTDDSPRIKSLVSSIAAVCMILLVATHFHYSVDTFVGACVGYSAYFIMHTLISVYHTERAAAGRSIDAADGVFIPSVLSPAARGWLATYILRFVGYFERGYFSGSVVGYDALTGEIGGLYIRSVSQYGST